MATNELTIDKEFESLIPPHTDEEFAGLTASLKEEGCRDPIAVWKKRGIILDGMTRYRICSRRGIGYATKQIELPDRLAAKIWIVQNQLSKRNLTDFARVEAVLVLKRDLAIQAAERQEATRIAAGKTPSVPNSAQPGTSGRTVEVIASLAHVGKGTVQNVETVATKGTENLQAAARAGDISASMAADAAKNCCDELQDALADKTITKDEFADIRKLSYLRQGTALERLLAKRKLERQPGEDEVEPEHRTKPAKKPKPEKSARAEDVAPKLANMLNRFVTELCRSRVFVTGTFSPGQTAAIVREWRKLPKPEWGRLAANVSALGEAAEAFREKCE